MTINQPVLLVDETKVEYLETNAEKHSGRAQPDGRRRSGR
jgi:hypothetical protein